MRNCNFYSCVSVLNYHTLTCLLTLVHFTYTKVSNLVSKESYRSNW